MCDACVFRAMVIVCYQYNNARIFYAFDNAHCVVALFVSLWSVTVHENRTYFYNIHCSNFAVHAVCLSFIIFLLFIINKR